MKDLKMLAWMALLLTISAFAVFGYGAAVTAYFDRPASPIEGLVGVLVVGIHTYHYFKLLD